MYSGGPTPSDPVHPSAWDVFRARRVPHPPNPLRYSHTFRYAVGVIVLAVVLTVAVIPARSIESDMRADAEQARAEGFPDLPRGYVTERQLEAFIEEWNLNSPGSPSREQILDLSGRVGKYGDDSAMLNVAVMGSLFGVVFLAAVAFGNSLNNLQALGYGASRLSPAWAFISWLLPLLSFVVPWRVVTEAFHTAWFNPGDEPRSRPKWPLIVTALWGLAYAGLWILNPVTVTWFIPTADIDEWLNHFDWTTRMLTWLPVPALLTALVLTVVTFRQHAKYRELDRQAAEARQQARR